MTIRFTRRAAAVAAALVLTGPMLAPHALAQAAKPRVGLVMKSLANEFFKSMEEGARKFAAADGTFTLVPVGMNSETDIDTQISAVENFVTQKVDLICVAPADSVGLVAPVKRAIKAGKAQEMLQGLQADKSSDFQKLSRGHSEWSQLVQALKNKDTKFLATNTRLAQAL